MSSLKSWVIAFVVSTLTLTVLIFGLHLVTFIALGLGPIGVHVPVAALAFSFLANAGGLALTCIKGKDPVDLHHYCFFTVTVSMALFLAMRWLGHHGGPGEAVPILGALSFLGAMAGATGAWWSSR